MREVGLRPLDVTRPIGSFSGGNQQKAIIGRWLAADSRIFLFDEPTRGIDVGAKAEIYELIERLAAEGRAIIVVSSELPEVIRVSDRVLVMREGRIAATLVRANPATSPRPISPAMPFRPPEAPRTSWSAKKPLPCSPRFKFRDAGTLLGLSDHRRGLRLCCADLSDRARTC